MHELFWTNCIWTTTTKKKKPEHGFLRLGDAFQFYTVYQLSTSSSSQFGNSNNFFVHLCLSFFLNKPFSLLFYFCFAFIFSNFLFSSFFFSSVKVNMVFQKTFVCYTLNHPKIIYYLFFFFSSAFETGKLYRSNVFKKSLSKWAVAAFL